MPGKNFATGGKTPGLGRRKALGNITNTERKAGDTAPATKPRRALGDITNATPVQSSQSKAKHAETNLQKPALPQSYAKQVNLPAERHMLPAHLTEKYNLLLREQLGVYGMWTFLSMNVRFICPGGIKEPGRALCRGWRGAHGRQDLARDEQGAAAEGRCRHQEACGCLHVSALQDAILPAQQQQAQAGTHCGQASPCASPTFPTSHSPKFPGCAPLPDASPDKLHVLLCCRIVLKPVAEHPNRGHPDGYQRAVVASDCEVAAQTLMTCPR